MHQYEILRTLRQGLFTLALLALASAAQAADLVVLSTNSPVTLAGGSYSYGHVWLGNDGDGGPNPVTLPLTLNIQDGVTLSCTEFLNGFGVQSTVNQSGGSVTVTGAETGNGVGNRLSIGVFGHSNIGSYNLSGGALTATAGLAIFGADDYGTLTISGGTATLLGIQASWNNKGALTLSSGTLILGAQGIKPQNYYGGTPVWTGSITFSGGTLKLNNNGAIAVNFGTGTVDALFIDGVQQEAGWWGKTGSVGADHFNDTYFSGGGVLYVTQGSGGPTPLDHFDVTATSPQTADATFIVTVTAKDASGNTLTTDNSTVVTMTSSGSAQFDSDGDDTFGDNTKTLTSGTFTIRTKDSVAGSLTLTANGGGKTGTSLSITVNSSVPSLVDHFDVTATSPQTVGATFIVTVTAKDASGNTLTTDNSTLVTMTSSGSARFDSNGDGTFGDNTKTLTSGTFTIRTKDPVAEGVTLTASSGGKTGTSSLITVNPIVLTGDLVVLSTNSPVTLAGGSYSYGHVWLGNDGDGGPNPVTLPLTLNIQDGVTLSCTEFLNGFGVQSTVNQSGGSVTVTGAETGNGVGNRLSIGVFGHSNIGSYNLSGGALTATAGLATFGADDYGTLTISGGTATLLGIQASWNNKGALTLSSGTLILGAQGIKPQNYYGGTPVWTGSITFSGGTLKLNNNGAIAVNFGTGTVDALFIDNELQAAGTWGGTGSGANHINTTYFTGGGLLTVRTGSGGPAPLDHFDVAATSPQTAGSTFSVTVTAKDASGNTVTGFDGTVAMTETGGGSGGMVTPPTSSAFANGVLLSQSVTLSKAGTGVTLTVIHSAGSETGISDAFTVQSQFAAWGGGVAFSNDANSDGLANGLAWLLGAADSSANSASLLPKPSRSLNGDLVMSFRCLKAAMRGTAILYVQYSKDLGQADIWSDHQVAVPESSSTVGGVIFSVTSDGDYDDIIATIPASAAASGGKLFGRLLATE